MRVEGKRQVTYFLRKDFNQTSRMPIRGWITIIMDGIKRVYKYAGGKEMVVVDM